MHKTDTGTWLIIAMAAGAALYVAHSNKNPSAAEMKEYLVQWTYGIGDSTETKQAFIQTLNTMTAQEVADVYHYIHDYFVPGKNLPNGSDLFNRVQLISDKYGIFT